MNEAFESQKEKLISIKHEISLLHQQVNYLLRNEIALGLLDLDVLMNRTHTIYDQLCAINMGDEATEDDFELDPEAVAALFGGFAQQEENEEPNPAPDDEDEPEAPEVDEAPEMEPEPEMPVEQNEMEVEEEVNQEVEENAMTENAEIDERPEGDEFGFFFRFEDEPENEKENESESEVTPAVDEPVERDGKLVHILEPVSEEDIPERDLVNGDELVSDNPFEMPQMEDETPENESVEQEVPASQGLSGYFENDDTEFELSTNETLGERMMQDDHSLAAKFQQNPIRDLKSVIGINDKFLFVNELFGGSMEKYNKSIENLNDLKTLNGAMIYLNELKIELQWNSSNEAYQKLKELVSRKFE